MIKQRGSIMPTIFDFLYREYCRARLAEMRKQLLLVSAESHWSQEQIAMSVIPAIPLVGMVLATTGQPHSTKPPHSLSARSQPANGGALDKLRSLAWCGRI